MNSFVMWVSRGAVGLERRWVGVELPDGSRTPSPRENRGSVGRGGLPTSTTFSVKSRTKMRRVMNALPWDEVPRLHMLTLTLPGDFREYVPDGAAFKAAFRKFRKRWQRKWGQPRGVWVLEFQERGAPHVHLYVGLPDGAVTEESPYDGRMVWDWGRQAWHDSVKGADCQACRERRCFFRMWGLHIRRTRYGEMGEQADSWKRVGDYFWRESGKWAQKQASEGFEGMKWWDVWGMTPVEHERELTKAEFVKARRQLRKLREKRSRTGYRMQPPKGLDGLAVYNVDGYQVGVLLARWAASETEKPV